jgi:2-polyprenyl-3-methyl-5-hydroxy-6-metoxy-1,4-benzoquinol methylase
LALELLSLSPHHLAAREPAGTRRGGRVARLEAALDVALDSRSRLCASLLSAHGRPGATWMDYGCGYGCMARAAADHAGRVYGVDVSSGALACARILNAKGPRRNKCCILGVEAPAWQGATTENTKRI